MILQLLASRLIPHWFDKTRSKRILLFGTKAKPSIIVLFFVDLYRRSSLLFFFLSIFYFLSLSLSLNASVSRYTRISLILRIRFFFLYIYINSCDFKGTSLIRIPRGELLSLSPFVSRKKMCQQYRKARDPDSAEPFSPIPDIVLLDDKRTDFGCSFFSLTFSISPRLHRSRVAPFPSSLVRRELYPDLSANDR